MNETQLATGFATLALAALIVLAVIAWDAYAIKAKDPTVSQETMRLSFRHPLVAGTVGIVLGWAVGVLTGHFWWPQFMPTVAWIIHLLTIGV